MKTTKIATLLISAVIILFLTLKLVLFGRQLVRLSKVLTLHEKDILSNKSLDLFATIRSSKLEASKEGFVPLPNAGKIWDFKTQAYVETGIKNGVCRFLAFIQSLIVTDLWEEIKTDLIVIKRHNDRTNSPDVFVDEFLKFNNRYFNDEFKEDYANLYNNYMSFITSINKFLVKESITEGYSSITMIGVFFFKLRSYINPHTSAKLGSLISRSVRNDVKPNYGGTIYKFTDPDSKKEADEKIFSTDKHMYASSKYLTMATPDEITALTNDGFNSKIKEEFLNMMNSPFMKKPAELFIFKISINNLKELTKPYEEFFDNDSSKEIQWLKRRDFQSVLTIEHEKDGVKRVYELSSYHVEVRGHVYACVKNKEGRFVNSEGHFTKENKLEYCSEKTIENFRSFILFYKLIVE